MENCYMVVRIDLEDGPMIFVAAPSDEATAKELRDEYARNEEDPDVRFAVIRAFMA